MQVVIMSDADFDVYRRSGLVPTTGAWVAYTEVPRCSSWEELDRWVASEVGRKEWYASKVSRRRQRDLRAVQIYADLHGSGLTRLDDTVLGRLPALNTLVVAVTWVSTTS